MKRWLLFVATTTLMAAVAPTARAQAPTWKIDPNHSELTFRIRHYVTRVRGTFSKWDGAITADPAALHKGVVQVTIDAKSIDTNNDQRDGHLKSNEFFATDSFPTLSFTSTKVDVKGESIRVFGDLTIRGISRPVVLEGAYAAWPRTRKGRNASDSRRRQRSIDSTKVTQPRPRGGVMLGDEVEITSRRR
jgi:polyisoprenoid-binding protein YceI